MKRILSILGLCLLAPAVFAAPNFFPPAENDQSMYYLATIFGNVGNILTQWSAVNESTLLKYAFLYFNNAVIVLGCILILYSLVVSTINTSHQGEMLGQKWNSVWIPLRTAMGFALLLPTTTTTAAAGAGVMAKGYAVIQVFVMWVIVQGVGAADYIWGNMVDRVASGDAGISVNTAVSATNDLETATNIFQYLMCSLSFAEQQGMRHYWTQESRPTWSTTLDSAWYKQGNNKGKGPYGYLETTPYLLYQDTDQKANMPYTYIWAFGLAHPDDWSRHSICGYVTMPSGEQFKTSDEALYNYYSRQKDLINHMIGFDPDNPKVTLGIYGGNWFGIFPTNGQNPQNNTAARGSASGSYAFTTTITQPDGTQKTTKLPNLSYLAESYQVYLDMGNVEAGPGSDSTSNASCTQLVDSDGNPVVDDKGQPVMSCPTNTGDYIRDQLEQVAVAYQAATAQNYTQYQTEEAIQEQQKAANTEKAVAGDSVALQPPTTNNPPPTTHKEILVAAAKYNGWAGAGAFFLDMTKALNTSTSSLSTTTYDYSYAALACQNGVGITNAGADRRCQDARSSADFKSDGPDDGSGGSFQQGHAGKFHNYGRGTGNSIGKTFAAMEGLALQALANAMNDGDDTTIPTSDGRQCTPLTDSSGNVIENCGVYNSAINANPAFNPNLYSKPRFPRFIINPLDWYRYVNASIMYNFSRTLQPIMSMGTGGQMANPLFVLRSAGLRMLNTSSKLYHIGFKYMWISGLTSYVFSGMTGIANAMTSAMTWGAAMYNVIIGMMMTMGAIMAYYFPLIPYLVFTFAFIQWLVLTIEAMTAAPLLCLGILHPEGQHEVFGHSSMGIAILASVFLRPPLMIIGYFAATVLSYVVVLVVNGGFFFAANSLLGGASVSDNTSAASMFGTLIIWGMYVNTLMVVLNKSFTLIYHIPDHVVRWIGITEGHSSDIEQMMGQVKQGVEKGAETAKSAGDAQAKARSNTMHAYGGAINEVKEKGKQAAQLAAGMPPSG